jgi:UDP-glucose:(heptosyl)LPS alpha-1,3-glucosyltransferase
MQRVAAMFSRTPVNEKGMERPTIVQAVRAIGPGGGINGVAYNLEREFQRRGYKCRRFTLADAVRWRRGQAKPSSHVVWEKLVLIFDIVAFSVFGTWGLRRSLRGRGDCVVLCHNDVLVGDIYVNHGLHRAMWRSRPDRWKMLVRNPLHLFLLFREALRYRLPLHRKIICFGATEKRQLLENYPVDADRVTLIPNGVDIERFRLVENTRHDFRSRHGVGEDQFVALFVGYEFVRKGLRFAIEALAQLPDNVLLWVVGTDRSSFENHRALVNARGLARRVRFWGTRTDVEVLFQASDVFVLPTFYETWALVGLEAMACGRPVIMSAVGGITEYLRDGKNGFSTTRDPQDIAEKIRRLLEDPDLVVRLGACARETAEQFSWKRVAGQYLSVIEALHEEAFREADGKSQP